MNSVGSIALSGMNAAQRRLDTSGHNLANLATEGFRRQTLQATPLPSGGVTTDVTTASEPGNDLAADVVGLMSAKHEFVANLQVFKTEDRMLGTLLDTQG